MFLVFLFWIVVFCTYFVFGQNSSTANYAYEGCFELSGSETNLSNSSENSYEYCYENCYTSAYFGLKRDKCYCLTVEQKTNLSKTSNDTCSTVCPGNETQICGEKGGPGHITLFGLNIGNRTIDRNMTTTKPNSVDGLTSSKPTIERTRTTTESDFVNATIRNNTTDGNATGDGMNNSTLAFTVSTDVTDSSGNSTSRDLSVNDSSKSDATAFPNVFEDIDEGLVAGMSMLVIGAFAGCLLIVLVRKCYRKRQVKRGTTVYEEVEDAATSCSIEGSSNIKLLIGRARNINKSRIEQINEEWLAKKPLVRPEEPIVEPEVTTPPPDDSNENPISKTSIRSTKRTIIQDEEDSEYATAEPEEDLYSLAAEENDDDLYDTASGPEDTSGTSPPKEETKASRRKPIKLQRSLAIDEETEEDPYEETPQGEYDVVHSPRRHKNASSVSHGQYSDQEDDEEHQYEFTEFINNDDMQNSQPHADGIHRSKAEQRLYAKSSCRNSDVPKEENIYNESFEGEYDVLYKPRCRFTFSSDNYDNVVLPWEQKEKNVKSETSDGINESNFDSLEGRQNVVSNLYSDMDSIMKTNDSENKNRNNGNNRCDSTEFKCETVTEENNGNVSKGITESENGEGKTDTHDLQDTDITLNERPTSVGSNSTCSRMAQELESTINYKNESILDNANFDDSNQNLIIENKCYGLKIGNGNITDHKLNDLDFDENLNGDLFNMLHNAHGSE